MRRIDPIHICVELEIRHMSFCEFIIETIVEMNNKYHWISNVFMLSWKFNERNQNLFWRFEVQRGEVNTMVKAEIIAVQQKLQ